MNNQIKENKYATFHQFFEDFNSVKIMEKYLDEQNKIKFNNIKKCSKLMFDKVPKKVTIISRLDETSVSALTKLNKIKKIDLDDCNDVLTLFGILDSSEIDDMKIVGSQPVDCTALKFLKNLKNLEIKNDRLDLSFIKTLPNLENLTISNRLENPHVLN